MKFHLLILSIFACLNSHAQEKYFSYRYEHCNTTVFLHSEIDGDPYFKNRDSVREKLQGLVGTWECETEGVFDLNITYDECVECDICHEDQCYARNVEHADFTSSYDIEFQYLNISDINEKLHFYATWNSLQNGKFQRTVVGHIYFMGDNKIKMDVLGVSMNCIITGLYHSLHAAPQEIKEDIPGVFKNGPYIFTKVE